MLRVTDLLDPVGLLLPYYCRTIIRHTPQAVWLLNIVVILGFTRAAVVACFLLLVPMSKLLYHFHAGVWTLLLSFIQVINEWV